ncbi:Os02g0203300 [Oryza sativa Japonica Group]|uniref:Glycosyltransferase n=1 Tax=Oryza sativa subsp. japonica TaxID=39947 RepID=A0A0N7KEW3_ORYSJ|nr:hypothetical protein EE612_009596 [Oryza sativa]BAS77537.1 Os02g0203300 [Oryza sativa Japonica Group]
MIYLVKSYQFFHNYLSHIYTHTLGHLGVKEQPYILAGNAGYISQHPKLVFVANTSYPNSGHGAPALPRRRVPWPGPHQPGPSPRRAPRPRHRRARHPVRRRVGAPAHVPVPRRPRRGGPRRRRRRRRDLLRPVLRRLRRRVPAVRQRRRGGVAALGDVRARRPRGVRRRGGPPRRARPPRDVRRVRVPDVVGGRRRARARHPAGALLDPAGDHARRVLPLPPRARGARDGARRRAGVHGGHAEPPADGDPRPPQLLHRPRRHQARRRVPRRPDDDRAAGHRSPEQQQAADGARQHPAAARASHDLYRHDEKGYMEWLDAKPAGSVVYVSFGSMSVVSRRQKEELRRGLAATARPYLWVVRSDDRDDGDGDGDGGGMVVEWCDQVRVLSHGAVGCFVTHCGWNSTLEAVACGAPMVAVPQWSDQDTNARLVAGWGVGVRAATGADRVVEAGELARCVETVMADTEAAAAVRRSSVAWKAKVREAVAEGGSSDRNLKAFLDRIANVA